MCDKKLDDYSTQVCVVNTMFAKHLQKYQSKLSLRKRVQFVPDQQLSFVNVICKTLQANTLYSQYKQECVLEYCEEMNYDYGKYINVKDCVSWKY